MICKIVGKHFYAKKQEIQGRSISFSCPKNSTKMFKCRTFVLVWSGFIDKNYLYLQIIHVLRFHHSPGGLVGNSGCSSVHLSASVSLSLLPATSRVYFSFLFSSPRLSFSLLGAFSSSHFSFSFLHSHHLMTSQGHLSAIMEPILLPLFSISSHLRGIFRLSCNYFSRPLIRENRNGFGESGEPGSKWFSGLYSILFFTTALLGITGQCISAWMNVRSREKQKCWEKQLAADHLLPLLSIYLYLSPFAKLQNFNCLFHLNQFI